MKKILVTGGAGFIGTNLCKKLFKNNYKVYVIDNESNGNLKNIKKFIVKSFNTDFSNKETLNKIKGIDVVIHLAANSRVIDSIKNPKKNFNENVIKTFKLINWASNNNVNYFINASTGGAILGKAKPPINEDINPKPISPYGASKLAIEGYCHAFNEISKLKLCSLRFSNVYGPHSDLKDSVIALFYKKIIKGEDIYIYGTGKQSRDFLFIDDLINGDLNSIKYRPTGVIQLASGKQTTLKELLKYMQKITKKKIEPKYQSKRLGEVEHVWCEIKKAKKLINFKIKNNLFTNLKYTWLWYNKKINQNK